jgi:hypothetical protein
MAPAAAHHISHCGGINAASLFPERSLGPNNNPKTAMHHFIQQHPYFVIDRCQAFDQCSARWIFETALVAGSTDHPLFVS